MRGGPCLLANPARTACLLQIMTMGIGHTQDNITSHAEHPRVYGPNVPYNQESIEAPTGAILQDIVFDVLQLCFGTLHGVVPLVSTDPLQHELLSLLPGILHHVVENENVERVKKARE